MFISVIRISRVIRVIWVSRIVRGDIYVGLLVLFRVWVSRLIMNDSYVGTSDFLGKFCGHS